MERAVIGTPSLADADDQRTARYYDRLAPVYDAQVESDPRNRVLRDAFRGRVSQLARMGGTILDFGCGTGLDAEWYAARGHRVVAYDASAGMVDELRTRCASDISQGRIIPVAGSLADLDSALAPHAPVAAIAANFAVLNHFADLTSILGFLGARLLADGAIVASLLNPIHGSDMRQGWWWRGLAGSLTTRAISFRGDVTTHRHFLSSIPRAAGPQLSLTEVAHVDAAGKWSSVRLGWRDAMALSFVFVVLRRNA